MQALLTIRTKSKNTVDDLNKALLHIKIIITNLSIIINSKINKKFRKWLCSAINFNKLIRNMKSTQ